MSEKTMKWILLAMLGLTLTGCEKTIHEACANHTSADTRSTAAVSGLTYSCPNRLV